MKRIVVCFLLFLTWSINSQNNAAIDNSFNTEGWFGSSGIVSKIAHANNGKIIVGGIVDFYKSTPVKNIFRLNYDGSLDQTFNPGNAFSNKVVTFSIQQDGKIVVAGIGDTGGVKVKRLNEDGSLDSTFGAGFSYPANCIALQTDGKILVGGTASLSVNKQIIRLNANGTLDNTFSAASNLFSSANCILSLASGKIIVGGNSNSSSGSTCLLRLNSDGSTDNTFPATLYGVEINTISLQDDGKIIVGGEFELTVSSGNFYNVARLNESGVIDNSFTLGKVDYLEVYASSVREDGKILIGGNFTQYNQFTANNIVCLNSDGTQDTSFQENGGFNYSVYTLENHSNNTFWVGGNFTKYGSTLADSIILLDPTGVINNTFEIGSVVAKSSLRVVCPQSDGKILVGGHFNHYNNTVKTGLTRFNADGTLDSSFNIGSGFGYLRETGSVSALAVQSDGKIIVGGVFSSYNGFAETNIFRLNDDGSKDISFNIPNVQDLNYSITKILIQPNGKILVVGTKTSDSSSSYIYRYNSDGSLDSSFNVTARFNGAVNDFILQPDGKFILAGRFTSYNGIFAPRIIRLINDGTIDNSFMPGSGFSNSSSYVVSLGLQSDGKILASGFLYQYNGNSTYRYFIRLNSDGSLDNSLNLGSGFDGPGIISLDSEGKIILGGSFTAFNGNTQNGLVRLNADGTRDALFDIGSGFDKSVSGEVILPSGKIIVFGGFSTYSGVTAKQIIQLNGNATLGTSESSDEIQMSYQNPVNEKLSLEFNKNVQLTSYSIFDLSGIEIKSEKTFEKQIDVKELSTGVYFIKVSFRVSTLTRKFIKE